MTATITFEQEGKEALVMTVTAFPDGHNELTITAKDPKHKIDDVSGLHAALMMRLMKHLTGLE